MVKREYVFIVLLILLLLSACRAGKSSGCRRVYPQEFSESDLIGTWGGTVETAWDSTIIIGENAQYKQIMHIERTEFKYESGWLPWRVTYSEDGLPYLHLQGLLMCAYWGQLNCATGKTGLEPFEVGDTKDPFSGEYYWYDFCQKEWVETPGEGVFMVFGGSYAPRGLELVPFTKSADGTTGPSYHLREP